MPQLPEHTLPEGGARDWTPDTWDDLQDAVFSHFTILYDSGYRRNPDAPPAEQWETYVTQVDVYLADANITSDLHEHTRHEILDACTDHLHNTPDAGIEEQLAKLNRTNRWPDAC